MTSTKRWTRTSLVLAIAGLLLLSLAVTGCNEERELEEDTFFSIEDYAQDQDYARTFIDLMNRWHTSTERAKTYLGGNTDNPTFDEAVPQGWKLTSESEIWRDHLLFEGQDPWYFLSFQDSYYEFITFNRDVPGDVTIDPSKVEYMRLETQMAPNDVQVDTSVVDSANINAVITTGDSVAIGYADGFLNQTLVEGTGMFANFDLLFVSTGTGGVINNFPAVMENTWRGELQQMAASPGNPAGTFVVNGFTVLARTDVAETTVLEVEAEVEIRSNGRGEGEIRVEGEPRARIFIQYVSDGFHGYVTLASSDFKQQLSF